MNSGCKRSEAKIIAAYMPMIKKIALISGGKLEKEDAISAGTIGMIEGLRRFEPERGFRIGTYVRHYIKEAVLKEGGLSYAIKLPGTRDYKARQMLSAAYKKASNENTAFNMKDFVQTSGIKPERVRDAMERMQHQTSGAYTSLDDAHHIPDSTFDIIEEISRGQELAIIDQALEGLTDREEHIFRERVLASDDVKTLEYFGQIYGVSRERIRQIEVIAIKKFEKRLGPIMKAYERLAA